MFSECDSRTDELHSVHYSYHRQRERSEWDYSTTAPVWKQEETLAKWSLRRSFSVLRSADQTAGARRSKIKQHKKNKTLQKKKKKKDLKCLAFCGEGKRKSHCTQRG